jgi:starch synthase
MDLLASTLELLLQDAEFQFVILGSGEESILRRFEHVKRIFPDRVGVWWGYDEKLAHLIEAGLDIYLMPSRYEPCGLNQMYSLRYGTIPVVRATGGLDDTIREWDEKTNTGTGFKFSSHGPEELYHTVRKALRKFEDTEQWKLIQRNAMRFAYPWSEAVPEYERVYAQALERVLPKA